MLDPTWPPLINKNIFLSFGVSFAILFIASFNIQYISVFCKTNKQTKNKQKIDVDRDMICFVDVLIRLNSIKSRELVQVIWLNGRHEFGD